MSDPVGDRKEPRWLTLTVTPLFWKACLRSSGVKSRPTSAFARSGMNTTGEAASIKASTTSRDDATTLGNSAAAKRGDAVTVNGDTVPASIGHDSVFAL